MRASLALHLGDDQTLALPHVNSTPVNGPVVRCMHALHCNRLPIGGIIVCLQNLRINRLQALFRFLSVGSVRKAVRHQAVAMSSN